jgi:protein-disulfide isomerase
MQTRSDWLDRLSKIAVVVALMGVAFKELWPTSSEGRAGIPVPVEAVSIVDGAAQGDADAPLAMIMFSDFECPYCAKFANETWPVIKKQFVDDGRLRVVFRHLPLPIHDSAIPAAISAECARQQGMFWEMHDRIFAEPTRMSETTFTKYATELKTDVDKWLACRTEDGRRRVQADEDRAGLLGVNSTPTLMLGRPNGAEAIKIHRVIQGSLSADELSKILTAEVKQ